MLPYICSSYSKKLLSASWSGSRDGQANASLGQGHAHRSLLGIKKPQKLLCGALRRMDTALTASGSHFMTMRVPSLSRKLILWLAVGRRRTKVGQNRWCRAARSATPRGCPTHEGFSSHTILHPYCLGQCVQ